MREKFEGFITRESTLMLHNVTKTIEYTSSTASIETSGINFQTFEENRMDKAIDRYITTIYTQVFDYDRWTNDASSKNILQLEIIYADLTKELARLQAIVPEV